MKKVEPNIWRFPQSKNFPDGCFEARYRDPNGRKRGKRFRTKTEARRFLKIVNAQVEDGSWIDPRKGRTLLEVVAERWLAEGHDLKPKTRAGYESILESHVRPAFRKRSIKDFVKSDIQGFVRSLISDGKKPGTVHNVFRVVSLIFEFAVGDGLIKSNPCTNVKLPKRPREEMLFLSTEEVHALAAAIKPPYGMLVKFAAYTGLRAGEIAALRVEHLDLLRRTVDVSESVADVNGKLVGGSTKTHRRRSVALPSFLADELTEYLGNRLANPKAFVFPNSQGGQLRHNNFSGRYFKPAVIGALSPEKHRLRFHDLRHTCAAVLIDSGAHPKDICDWLGHSSITVTMDRYGHRFGERNGELAALLQARFETLKPAETAEIIALSR